LKRSGENFGLKPGIMQEFANEQKKTVEDLTEEDEAEIQERYHGVTFLLGLERSRFGKLIEDLEKMITSQSHALAPIAF
jgi:hypothetical protein